MAMQATSPAAPLPSAQVVGNAFVEQYYHILHQSPELVYKFYQDSSVLTRPDWSGAMTSVTTMQAINDKILSLDYKNYKAEIKTADAQESFKEGVIVLVTGCLTGKDNVRRKFAQTFFLAPQEKGYFVLNDVFRYIDENESLEISSRAVTAINDNVPTASLESDTELAHAPDHSVSDPVSTYEAEDMNNEAEVVDPSDNGEGSVIEDEVVDELPTDLSRNEIISNVSSDPSAIQEEKKSYASIVKVPKAPKASTPVYVPTNRVRSVTANANQQTPVSSKPSTEVEASAPTNGSGPESRNPPEEVEGHSIYIRNLPLNATATELEEEVKKFGSIKHGGIQVRSNKQGFCFGFVEFESLNSMRDAIKASPISVGGRPAVVEEKRTTTRVNSSGRGRYPSGRGGFRNDNFIRGRGNFGGGRGGGRGYGRNEFRNQGEFSGRPKAPNARGGDSTATYQQVDQSSGTGGRGGRQGWMNKSAIPPT